MVANYQENLKKIIEEYGGLNLPKDKREAIALHALALAGEAGEIANKAKKIQWYKYEICHLDLAEELGDTLWHLSQLADVLGYTLDQIAQISIQKTIKKNEVNSGN